MCFFAYLDRTALAILLPPIKAELKLTDTELGLLTGFAFAAFYATLGLPLARLAERTSRVRLISVCLLVWSVMTALTGLARNFPQLFLARMGVGVGEAGCVPPSHSLIGDIFPPERRALAVAIFQSGSALGGAGGLFLVGVLADRYGWRVSLQAVGLAGAPLALMILLSLREPRRPAPVSETREPALRAMGQLLRRPALVHLIIAYALGAICSYGAAQWTPSFLVRSYAMSLADVGFWCGSSSGLGGILGLLSGGALATWLVPRDRRWEMRIPVIAYAIYVPVSALIFLAPLWWLAILFNFVAFFLSGLGGGVALAAVQSFAEPHRRATAIAIVMFMSSLLGLGLGPFLIGVASDLWAPSLGKESLRYALLTVCLLVAWSTAHFVMAERRMMKDLVDARA
jgi:MFS family permease